VLLADLRPSFVFCARFVAHTNLVARERERERERGAVFTDYTVTHR
jgi:hypothetical protein